MIRTVSSLKSSTSASFTSLHLIFSLYSHNGSNSKSLGISVSRSPAASSFVAAAAAAAVAAVVVTLLASIFFAPSRRRVSRLLFRVRLMLTSSSSSAKMSALAVLSMTAPFLVLHTTHCFADIGLLNVHAGHTHFSSAELIVTVTDGRGFAFACVTAWACAFSSSRCRRAASWSGLNDCGLETKDNAETTLCARRRRRSKRQRAKTKTNA